MKFVRPDNLVLIKVAGEVGDLRVYINPRDNLDV